MAQEGNVQVPMAAAGQVAIQIVSYTSAVDITFVREDLGRIHRIKPTANIVITMPVLEPEDDYQITNLDGTFSITVKDSTGAITASTLSASGAVSMFKDAVAAGFSGTHR